MTATMLAAMAWRMSTPSAVSIGMMRTPPPRPMRAPRRPAPTAPRRMASSNPGAKFTKRQLSRSGSADQMSTHMIIPVTPLLFTLVVFAVSIGAGLLGSLLGLGGGIIVIPALTLLLHIDIRYAIGASIVSVIATSSGAAAAYVREHLTNLRVAMLLEIATASGALSGAYLVHYIG